jgi:hypothetical protein
MLQGSGLLAEHVLPRLAIPVGAALVVTVLWWLTGWTWFDVGPWPWAIGALPVALLLALRVHAAGARHGVARQAVLDAVAGLRGVGGALVSVGADPGPALGALRLLRHRFAPGSLLADLQGVLDEPTMADVRGARDPQAALLAATARASDAAALPASADLDRARGAFATLQATSYGAAPLAVGGELALIFLATLPVGLVTTTGNLTFLAVGGVALAFLTLDALAADLERPPGSGAAWRGFEGIISSAERDIAPPAPGPLADPGTPSAPADALPPEPPAAPPA